MCRVMSSVLKTVVCSIALMLLVACDSDGDDQLLSNLVSIADDNLTGLNIQGTTAVLSIGQTTTLDLSARTDAGTTVGVSDADWTSSDTSIATVSNSGVVTAGGVDGDVTITASFGILSTSTVISVSSAPLNSIDILVGNSSDVIVEIDACRDLQLSAQGFFQGEEGSPRNISDSVLWSASPATASIDDSEPGLLRTTVAGTVTVTATSENLMTVTGSPVVGTQDFTVADTLTAIRIEGNDSELRFGNAVQFRAIATYSDGSEADVTDNTVWAIDDGASTDFAEVFRGLVEPSRAGDGMLRASCGGQSVSVNIAAGTNEVDEVLIGSGNDLNLNLPGNGSITLNLVANALFAGMVVRDVTEDSDWSLLSTNGRATVSSTSGTRGRLVITGPTTVTVQAVFTNDDGVSFAPSIDITASQ